MIMLQNIVHIDLYSNKQTHIHSHEYIFENTELDRKSVV